MSGKIGDNVYRASGVVAAAAAAGGGVSWQAVTTGATLTAVAGNGYPIDTGSNACTVTLPAAASVGDEIILTDYARNWNTNAVTINPNSLNYQGNTTPQPVYDTNGESVHIVYMDTTNGWIPTYDGAVALETPQTFDVEYLCVGGGGGGGSAGSGNGGAGAGGYRTNYGGTAVSFDGGTVYTLTVGTGGAGSTVSGTQGTSGVNSSIAGSGLTTITSTGGGGGGSTGGTTDGAAGGSGGGGATGTESGGAGNSGGNGGSPSIPEGFDGGDCTVSYYGAGGGGSSEAGEQGSSYPVDGTQRGEGGDGLANTITGSSVTYGGGGGGGYYHYSPPGGSGGGGEGGSYTGNVVAVDGTDGLGGGGGAAGGAPSGDEGGDGGNGIIILRMADAKAAAGTKVNEASTATDVGGSGETVITWLVDGSFTAG